MNMFVLFTLMMGCGEGNPLNEDNDGDGFSEFEGDCDDSDPSVNPADEDGDGISICDGDCNDNDPSTLSDMDCDGVLSVDDCDDLDATTVNDMDCDGVLTADDCNDNDSGLPVDYIDFDCDGVLDCNSLVFDPVVVFSSY